MHVHCYSIVWMYLEGEVTTTNALKCNLMQRVQIFKIFWGGTSQTSLVLAYYTSSACVSYTSASYCFVLSIKNYSCIARYVAKSVKIPEHLFKSCSSPVAIVILCTF